MWPEEGSPCTQHVGLRSEPKGSRSQAQRRPRSPVAGIPPGLVGPGQVGLSLKLVFSYLEKRNEDCLLFCKPNEQSIISQTYIY